MTALQIAILGLVAISITSAPDGREGVATERTGANPDPRTSERARLRAELLELTERIKQRRPVARRPEPGPMPRETASIAPADPLLAAQGLFRANDYNSALHALRSIELSRLSPGDRAFLKYLNASCLRKLGKLPEAAALYQEVANENGDEFFAESAVWQIGAIRSTQEAERKLAELRSRGNSK
jgi:hypothetical protein